MGCIQLYVLTDEQRLDDDDEFVDGSRLALRVFFQVLQFSSLQKTTISKFQFNQDRETISISKPAKTDVASSLYIVKLILLT